MLTTINIFDSISTERRYRSMTEAMMKQCFQKSFANMSKFIKFKYVVDNVDGITYSNFNKFVNGNLNMLSLSACLKINDYLQDLASEIVPFKETWELMMQYSKKIDE